MPDTYTQIHIQAVFAVKDRHTLISKTWESELYKYITGIIQNHGHKLLAINGMSDHIHILFGMRPVESLSNLIREIKSDSSRWVNEKRFVLNKFSWQEGYGAFSYSKSQIHHICTYIENQKEHHQKKSFTEEYRNLLKEFDIDFDERYIFKSIAKK